ncbi:cysteine proteinase inhibitor 12 isoform X2 [Andrographis paniculata]|uniref:cysteine proteinase inhibitor 12 isoform X2 n=1 Tax=Andrographis paniculata TaxID=175694 RepID=UPI0021E7C6A1|nr:cysteine proteinase inhibitor 12 isoform X2 [Andrographis paniculata]
MRALPLSFLLLLLLPLFALPLRSQDGSAPSRFGFCPQQLLLLSDLQMAAPTLGGLGDSHADIDSLARFAVQQHNTNENALLELVRVVKAQEQVVAGKLHHLTLEILDAGKKKIYEAKIWVKPWKDSKELQEFKYVEDIPSFTSSDLGVKKDQQTLGSQSVPVHDPLVLDAAHHAVKTIQGRSNSLFPYELSEVVNANAEVVEMATKFDMLLKVKRGGKEEMFKVEVHRDSEGSFQLNKMESDGS